MKKLRWFLGTLYMRLSGWRIVGGAPEVRKFVLVATPHTSNWDLPVVLALTWVLGLRIHWLGKKQLFRWPFGWFMRLLGGVSVDRSAPQGTVTQVAEAFRGRDEFVLLIPAEGTRSRAEYWKSGFYYIAKQAEVPLVLGRLDWGPKTGMLDEPLWPSDDVLADMDRVRAFYDGTTAKFPKKFGPIRIKEEAAAREAAEAKLETGS